MTAAARRDERPTGFHSGDTEMRHKSIPVFIPVVVVSTMVRGQDHPQKLMEECGLKYIEAVPQSLYDCWVFFGVENTRLIRLPVWAEIYECEDATIYIGNGIDKDTALRINDWILEKINGVAKALTVSELIKELEKVPGDLKIMVQGYEGGYTPLSKLRIYGRTVAEVGVSASDCFGEFDEAPNGDLVITFDRG